MAFPTYFRAKQQAGAIVIEGIEDGEKVRVPRIASIEVWNVERRTFFGRIVRDVRIIATTKDGDTRRVA